MRFRYYLYLVMLAICHDWWSTKYFSAFSLYFQENYTHLLACVHMLNAVCAHKGLHIQKISSVGSSSVFLCFFFLDKRHRTLIIHPLKRSRNYMFTHIYCVFNGGLMTSYPRLFPIVNELCSLAPHQTALASIIKSFGSKFWNCPVSYSFKITIRWLFFLSSFWFSF